jgi:hypothetical protein
MNNHRLAQLRKRGFALWVLPCLLTLASSVPLAGPAAAADAVSRPVTAFQLIGTVALPNNQSISATDVSVADAQTGIYAFADRTNASVDVFALNDNQFVDGKRNPDFPRQIGLAFQVPGFVGAFADHAVSGPDGLIIVNHAEIWAGDGDSTVKVINIASRQITDIIPTGGAERADEGAFDPVDQVVLIANDAESPFPFISLISTVPDASGVHQILGQITFDGSVSVTSDGSAITLPAATNGIEASQFDPVSGMFFLDIPQNGANGNTGATVMINPQTFTVEKVFTITNCQPTGMALGPNSQALLGCSVTNDNNATPLPAQVIDLTTGATLGTFPAVTGNDEVWFNPGDNNYYAAEQDNVPTALGIIHADTLKFDQSIPVAAGTHSVAADPISNRVFMPLVAGTANAVCPNGCVGIFRASSGESVVR